MAEMRQFFTDVYQRENCLEPSTTDTYLAAISCFETWFFQKFNQQLTWFFVTTDQINDFLITYAIGRSKYTVLSRRRSLLAVINAAMQDGLCTYDAKKVRRIKPKGTPKDFWTLDDVTKLIESAKQLKGRFRATQIRKDKFAEAYIRLMWDTCLRRGDMGILKMHTIDSNRQFSHPRMKSGVTDVCRFNVSTYNAIMDTVEVPRKLVFPYWQKNRSGPRAVSELFKGIMNSSGLTASDSCLKKLVRSSIMEADYLAPGTGWLQGHHASPETTMQAYANRQRANLNRPVNREIA